MDIGTFSRSLWGASEKNKCILEFIGLNFKPQRRGAVRFVYSILRPKENGGMPLAAFRKVSVKMLPITSVFPWFVFLFYILFHNV